MAGVMGEREGERRKRKALVNSGRLFVLRKIC